MSGTEAQPRWLVLAPHCDDAEFGMGGCIAQALRLNQVDSVHVIVAAHGAYTRSDGRPVLPEERRAETEVAMRHLHPDVSFEFGGWMLENGGLSVEYGTLVSRIEKAVRQHAPTDVFVCLPSFNQDHRALFDATVTAFRPGSLPQVRALWAYEYPGNCHAFGFEPPPQWGRCYIELEQSDVNRKMHALDAHVSQWEGRTGGVCPEMSMHLMAQRGAEAGVGWAEVNFLMRMVKPCP